MPLTSPSLDDRPFEQLVAEARRRIEQTCPSWTDLSPGDPGMVLVELFAHLTETMLYRLNRLPEKAYVEFLRLIGVDQLPPTAARVELRFKRAEARGAADAPKEPVEIPRGTRVTTGRTGGGSAPPVFVTVQAATLEAGADAVDVLAYHCEPVEAELAGIGTGLPGLVVKAGRPPIVAPTGDDLDLVVGIESLAEELDEQAAVIRHGERRYRIWREVNHFTNLGADRFAYVADRVTGTITFAPAVRLRGGGNGQADFAQALAEVPPVGREIRLWYRRGGGAAGNLAAGTLTVLKDAIAGLEVVNPSRATGGRPVEELTNALVRGPQELHSLHRAVTARDYEQAALYHARTVARAKAVTQAALWAHATPGTVKVLLVPHVAEAGRGPLTAAQLQEEETEAARAQIAQVLDERRPLGTALAVSWARYKTVRVMARIVVRREEDLEAVRQRVLERLYQTINPLPTPRSATGWPFGQALRTSHVYDIALAEPGVLWMDGVRLLVEDVPNQDVHSLTADAFQDGTWYAGSGATLFRSLNSGDGWEAAGHFPDEEIDLVRAHASRAGYLGVATRTSGQDGTRLHLSTDGGETWLDAAYELAFRVEDMTWIQRDSEPVLLLATSVGLYELVVRPGSGPVQVLVDAGDQDLGFYAVVAHTSRQGLVSVAAASREARGVYLSSEGGRSGSFRKTGLNNTDVRVLALQKDLDRTFLWAGTAAIGQEDTGSGCFRWELRGSEDPPEGWQAFGDGWSGGSCRGLAFLERQVLAASFRGGVLRLDASAEHPTWETPDVRCGLPLRDRGRFQPVDAVAADAGSGLVLVGGDEGVFRSEDGGTRYHSASSKEFTEKVTLPPTWLFCSGAHEITVVHEGEAD